MCKSGLEDALGVTMRDVVDKDHSHSWVRHGGSITKMQKFKCNICGKDKVAKMSCR